MVFIFGLQSLSQRNTVLAGRCFFFHDHNVILLLADNDIILVDFLPVVAPVFIGLRGRLIDTVAALVRVCPAILKQHDLKGHCRARRRGEEGNVFDLPVLLRAKYIAHHQFGICRVFIILHDRHIVMLVDKPLLSRHCLKGIGFRIHDGLVIVG